MADTDMASASLSPASFHPVLSVPLPPSFTSPSPSSSCHPYLLVSLPPALFLDPWQPPVSTAENPAEGSAPHAPIAAVHYLAAGHPSRVELERAVGWTRSGEGSRPSQSEGSSGGGGSEEHSSDAGFETRTVKRFVAGQGLVTETETVPARDTRLSGATIDRERETVLLRLPRWPGQPSESGSDAAASLGKVASIPLHARYLPPVERSQAQETREGSRWLQWEDLLDTLTGANGNYADVSIEGVEAFWACHAGGSAGSQDTFEQWLSPSGPIAHDKEDAASSEWERITRPSALLPKRHAHLTLPLLSSLASPDTGSDSTSQLAFYRHTPSSYSHGSAAAQANPLTIALPRGDASYAALSTNVTQAVVLIMTIWFIGRIWSLTKDSGRGEREQRASET